MKLYASVYIISGTLVLGTLFPGTRVDISSTYYTNMAPRARGSTLTAVGVYRVSII